MLEVKRIWNALQFQWNGQIGPAAILGVGQLIALCVGGAIVWTQLVDKVDGADRKIEWVQKSVGTISTTLATTQTNTSAQSERLGRVETSLQFITAQMSRFESRFDTGGNPAAPH